MKVSAMAGRLLYGATLILAAHSIVVMGETCQPAPQTGSKENVEDVEKAAVCWLQANEFSRALPFLNTALEELKGSRDAAYAYYLRAKVYTGEDDIQKATADLEKAVKLEPDLAAAWSDLGVARQALLDNKGALAAFERAVEQDANDSVAQYRLGEEYLREGKPHLAVIHLEQARKLDPEDQSTLNSLQMALRQDGRDARADEVAKQLKELLHQRDLQYQRALQAVALNNEGARLQKSGDLRGAVEKYRAALQADPGQVRIRVNLAIALLRTGDWSDGLSELKRAIQANSDDVRLRAVWSDAVAQAPPGTLVDGVPARSVSVP